jgi:predicted HAD superfamily Cof-like phosphohydrolase
MNVNTLKLVGEFQQAFDPANVGHEQPIKLPESMPDLAVLATKMTELGEELHEFARIKKEAGETLESTLGLRLQLCQEELAELATAMSSGDQLECLDALTDMQYVLDGTYHTLGLAHLKGEAFLEVQRSNMSKLGEDGKPIRNEAGRVVKGANYSPPDIEKILSSGGKPKQVQQISKSHFYHMQCSSCKQWWAVEDPNHNKSEYYCPHCGAENKVETA